MINFEATELRLGLPGGKHGGELPGKNNAKRGFSETVDLKLNLSSAAMDSVSQVDLDNMKENVVKPPANGDEDIKSSSTMGQGIKSYEEKIMEPRRPEEAKETKSSSTRPNDVGLNIHQPITHFKGNDRTRTHLGRPDLETVHEPPPGALTEAWKLPLGELARPNHIRLVIHQEITCFKKNDRAINQLGRLESKMGHDTSSWTVPRPRTWTTAQSTCANHLGFNIHQKTSYLMKIDREKTTLGRAGLRVVHLTHPWAISRPIKESFHFLHLGTSQHFIWKPGDHLEAIHNVPWCTQAHLIIRNQRRPNLPFLEPNAIKLQRLFPSHCCCVLGDYSMNLDVPKCHGFAPKLSRLKTLHKLPYLADLVHKASNG